MKKINTLKMYYSIRLSIWLCHRRSAVTVDFLDILFHLLFGTRLKFHVNRDQKEFFDHFIVYIMFDETNSISNFCRFETFLSFFVSPTYRLTFTEIIFK